MRLGSYKNRRCGVPNGSFFLVLRQDPSVPKTTKPKHCSPEAFALQCRRLIECGSTGDLAGMPIPLRFLRAHCSLSGLEPFAEILHECEIWEFLVHFIGSEAEEAPDSIGTSQPEHLELVEQSLYVVHDSIFHNFALSDDLIALGLPKVLIESSQHFTENALILAFDILSQFLSRDNFVEFPLDVFVDFGVAGIENENGCLSDSAVHFLAALARRPELISEDFAHKLLSIFASVVNECHCSVWQNALDGICAILDFDLAMLDQHLIEVGTAPLIGLKSANEEIAFSALCLLNYIYSEMKDQELAEFHSHVEYVALCAFLRNPREEIQKATLNVFGQMGSSLPGEYLEGMALAGVFDRMLELAAESSFSMKSGIASILALFMQKLRSPFVSYLIDRDVIELMFHLVDSGEGNDGVIRELFSVLIHLFSQVPDLSLKLQAVVCTAERREALENFTSDDLELMNLRDHLMETIGALFEESDCS
jgi:hypothetical protein